MKASHVPKEPITSFIAKNDTPDAATIPAATAPLTLVIPPKYAKDSAVSEAMVPYDRSDTDPNR